MTPLNSVSIPCEQYSFKRKIYQRLVHQLYESVADEISRVTRFYDHVIQYERLPNDTGVLFNHIQCPQKTCLRTGESLPDLPSGQDRTGILLNGNFNTSHDIEGLLKDLYPRISRSTRLFAVCYNSYLSPLFALLSFLGLRLGDPPRTFLTKASIAAVAKLGLFEIVRVQSVGSIGFWLGPVGGVLERAFYLVPFLRNLSLIQIIIFRPQIPSKELPTLSILVPARNEKGNLEPLLKRLPKLPAKMETIFIEGNSTDGTWEEINRVVATFQSEHNKLSAFKQTGKGKADAVRVGLSKASLDLVVVLDADMTMPPELLGRFYEAYCRGLGDFINGSRLSYEMEDDSMQFLNRLGNIFFAKALSAIIGERIGDALCGTKLFPRTDLERFGNWNRAFGVYDPFGDFEMLFPAGELAMGIVDVPIRYLARTYGTTNIRRFRDGWELLKMTTAGFIKLKLSRRALLS